MKPFLATAAVMCAFAANSLLNRGGLAEALIGPGAFAVWRVVAGAAMLLLLLHFRKRGLGGIPRPDGFAVAGLSAYLVGFSFAYVSMNAGIGALILFGGVQLTMFTGAIREGEVMTANRWIGAAISLAGLCLLLWPSEDFRISLAAFLLMTIAAVGWGVYSLIGRKAVDPLAATAWNFVYSVPVVLGAWLLFEQPIPTTAPGVLLAIISGAITSALGYAAWYAILPGLGASRAALAQLSVPVIALVFGAILLGEIITLKAVLASILVLGGILLGILRPGAKA